MTGAEPDVNLFLEKVRDIASHWDAAHTELETMRVSGVSDCGMATAVSDSGGTVIDLFLHPGLRSRGADVVAAALLRASERAVSEANDRRAALVSESVALALGARADAARDPGGVR